MPKSKSVNNPTFKSYIGENGVKEASSNSTFYGSEIDRSASNLQPQLLPGEAVAARAQNVVRHSLFSEKTQGGGIIGVFYVTNFRVIFLTSADARDQDCQRNKLVREDDIVLNCVETLYQVSKGKKKKLLLDGSASGTVKTLALHCKIHTFNFKMTPKDERKQAVRALIHHCFPLRLDLLFAFDYQPQGYTDSSDVPRFICESDWQREMSRLAVTGFKVLQCNTNFQNCDSLPEVLVVPESMDLPELKKYANQFVDYRFPIWSYTYQSKASLVRMACVIPDTHEPEVERTIYKKIRNTHPEDKSPVMLDFHELQQSQMLPSLKEVSQSFEKLRELCMPSKKKILYESEKSWFSSLDSCSWLSVVSKLIKTAVQVCDHMVRDNNTVILKESNSRDLTPVLSCLVQLMLDPHYRTLVGFQSLVEREWVALGHDFTNSCGLLHGSNESPVFILFLDCVWQLQVQFPSAFQFSEVYLTTLWDTVCMGLFENFIFDSVRKRLNAAKGFQQYNSTNTSVRFLSGWDWSYQFDKENLALFQNPLYITRTELKLNIQASHSNSMTSDENKRRNAYSRKLNKVYECVPNQDVIVLYPEASLPMLKFWSQCYLRWIMPLQIIGGGNPSGYLQQCVLVEEILCLQHQVKSLESDQQVLRSVRPKSELVFSFEDSTNQRSPKENVLRWTERVAVTSSFPFRTTSYQSTVTSVDTPISLFLNGSFMQDSEDEADTESVDALSILGPEDM